MDRERIYIDCECGTETICLEDWSEDKQICLAFFNLGHKGNGRSWRERFNHIWQILRTGYPYADMVIINHKQAEIMNNFIQSTLQK